MQAKQKAAAAGTAGWKRVKAKVVSETPTRFGGEELEPSRGTKYYDPFAGKMVAFSEEAMQQKEEGPAHVRHHGLGRSRHHVLSPDLYNKTEATRPHLCAL